MSALDNVRDPMHRNDVGWFCVFYGLTDAGKTYLLGSAMRSELTSPCLFLDVDQGDVTLSGRDIDVVPINSFADLQEVYDYLRDDNDTYRSVCLDSLSAQQADISMPTVLGEIDEERVFEDLSSFEPPTQRDWLSSGHQMKKVLMAFRQLARHPDPDMRVHVFMSAMERVDERRDIGTPDLPGKLGLGLGGYVDILARLVVDNSSGKEVRRLYTTKHLDDLDGFTYLGKNRLRLLPRRMKNPSVPKIMKYLIEE